MVLEKLKNKIVAMCPGLNKRINIILSERDLCRKVQPDIRDTEETIEYLLKTRCSMSRLGDGEFDQFSGGGDNYQRNDRELCGKLREILHSNVPNHIVCVTNAIVSLEERTEENIAYWKEYLKSNRHKFYKNIDMNKTYYNTSATRVYKLLANKELAGPRFEKWKQLWENEDVIFIEGKDTRIGVGNDLFSNTKSIRRIIGPAENAFDKWKELLHEAEKFEKSVLFILALGPTATVLSYELAKAGYRALDLGHIDVEYEWFLRHDYHIAIGGKYTNEVQGGNEVEKCKDEEYIKQIVYSTYWKEKNER